MYLKKIKKGIRIALWFVLGLISLILLYILIAGICSVIPVNKNFKEETEQPVTVYLVTNGVHSDIVLPVVNEYFDWSHYVDVSLTRSKDTLAGFLAFGWGDKGFYLNTPEWSDLTFSTAFKATFNLGTSAMHTTFYQQMNEGDRCVAISITPDQYKKMAEFIADSFQYDATGNTIHIPNASYGAHDSFYEARRTYNLFFTCNTWTNKALKEAEMKAALWTPSDKGIFYHYR